MDVEKKNKKVKKIKKRAKVGLKEGAKKRRIK